MHALLESDYAILTYILHFLLCAVAQSGGAWHNTPQARSQKFAMGGCVGVWGRSPQPLEARGLGAERPALENFAFFCKNNFILGLF